MPLKLCVIPGTGGLTNCKTQLQPKNKNHCMRVFDTSIKESECTGYYAKNPNLKTVPLLKKSGKNSKKGNF